MLNPIKVKGKVFWIGINDRETHLFEKLYPLHKGVAYNSYIINDEKVAILDTVKSFKSEEYIQKVKKVIGNKNVDYLIINHMEPDHSGSIEAIVNHYPNVKIVGNKKTFPMLESFYGIKNNLYEVREGDHIELGYHKLSFFMAPMVHWPETMVTYDVSEKILFSMDAFGSFGALNGGIFDDQNNINDFKEETIRYYSCIVGKVSKMVQNALKKLSGLKIKIICPTHGMIWRSNPEYIMNFYNQLSSYQTEDGVVIVYGSMYGNTEVAAEYLAKGLKDKGVKQVEIFDISKTDKSYIISSIWKYKYLLLGSPVYYGKLFPKMAELLIKLEEIGLTNHQIGIFGNYSWSGGAIKELNNFCERVKLSPIAEPVDIKGVPKEDDFEKLDKIVESIM